jgi:predicted amidohydrolase
MRDFTIAVGQWPVEREKDRNLERAEEFLRGAAESGASLCLLPEMFQTPYELPLMRSSAEPANGPTLGRIRGLARDLRVHVVAGSFCEEDGGRLFNSSFVVGPGGEILGAHRKIHLFDVSLPDVQVKESDVFTPGDRPLVLDLPFARLGVAICYDARFPAIFRHFEERGVEVVALPAAFSRTTGAAHWHVLMRSRAVDHQVYLAAACPAPAPGSSYAAYGHSLVVDPWGKVLAEAGEGAERILVRLGAERLARVRRELPLLAHRRPDLYGEWSRG